jgi:hypothetical protein
MGSTTLVPVNLGDITVNSWAVSTKLEPKEVMYYKVIPTGKRGARAFVRARSWPNPPCLSLLDEC